MTIQQIAQSAAKLLTADDIAALIETDPTDADVVTLVKCVNAAVAGVAADGFPAVKRETVTAADRTIPVSALSRRPLTVTGISDGCGHVRFGVAEAGFTVPHDGTYTVAYAVAPEEGGLSDEAEVGVLCDADMLAYLTARNYCLVTGRTDEAQIWDQMYETQSAFKRMARRSTLPVRTWR